MANLPSSKRGGIFNSSPFYFYYDFINKANEVLLEVLGQNKLLLNTDKSRYNSKIYMDSCAKCGKTKEQSELHVHHLIEQNNFKSGNLIKTSDNQMIRKNDRDNLTVLCRKCHTELHSNNQELETVITADGKLIRIKNHQ